MYIKFSGDADNKFTLKKRIVTEYTVRYIGVEPMPSKIQGTISVYTDSGYLLSEDKVEDFSRYEINGSTFIITNLPEPEPQPEPEPPPTYVTYEELARAIREGVNSVE